jgi:hypothetical protein
MRGTLFAIFQALSPDYGLLKKRKSQIIRPFLPSAENFGNAKKKKPAAST